MDLFHAFRARRHRRALGQSIVKLPPAGNAWAGLRGPSATRRAVRISRVAMRTLALAAAAMALIVASWSWPILPATGVIRYIYAVHDDTVLPLRGRFWDRNQPYATVAATAAALLVVMLIFMRSLLTNAYEALLAAMAGHSIGRGALVLTADRLSALGPPGAHLMDHALAIMDSCLETSVLGARPSGNEAQGISRLLLPLRMRRRRALRGEQQALYDVMRLALQCRLCAGSSPERRLVDALNNEIDHVRKPSSEDQLAQDALAVLDLLNCERRDRNAVNEVAGRLRQRIDELIRTSLGPSPQSADGWRLARTVALAVARTANDRDLALAWLDAEDRLRFAADLDMLSAKPESRGRPTDARLDPLLDELTLRPLAALELGISDGVATGLIDCDGDRRWWTEAHWRTLAAKEGAARK